MAIDFNGTFGARARNNNRPAANDLPKAQFWMNFGYLAGEGEEAKFVSLPVGIPLDTMERLSTRSSNRDFAMFQAARNDLLEQILEQANRLEPGDDFILPLAGESGLAVQIRRVNEEQQAPKTDESNPFARPKLFAAA